MIEKLEVISATGVRPMVALLSNGDKVVVTSESRVDRVVALVQDFVGNAAMVLAVFDGQAMYAVEWGEDTDPETW